MKSIGTALKGYLDRRKLNSELDVARVWLNWPDIEVYGDRHIFQF